MEPSAEPVAVGRLTKNGALFGYLAIDTQRWSFSKRVGLRSRRWSETRRRYRLDLLDDWDEGFVGPEQEANLQRGRFRFKGEALEYEELVGPEKSAVLSQIFADWD
jgi:hypothetical protein